MESVEWKHGDNKPKLSPEQPTVGETNMTVRARYRTSRCFTLYKLNQFPDSKVLKLYIKYQTDLSVQEDDL